MPEHTCLTCSAVLECGEDTYCDDGCAAEAKQDAWEADAYDRAGDR